MKKLIAMMAFVIISFGAMAQSEGFTRGSLFLSGSVGFNVTKDENSDVEGNNFNFSPKLGYFVTDKVAIGLNVGIGSSKFEDDANNELKEMTTAIGLFGRYYFTPANKFSMFMKLRVDYVSTKEEETGSADFKVNGFDIGVSPGLHYFISNRLALETSIGFLGYSTRKPDVDGAKSVNSFGLNLGLSNVSFGLVFKIK